MATTDSITPPVPVQHKRFPKRDLTGQRFRRLLVLGFAEYKNHHAHWQCRCDCNKLSVVCGTNLLRNHTFSCGCYNKDQSKYAHRRHGKEGTAAYHCWNSLIQRCTNPRNKKYHRYGGRGITVCKRWLLFDNFYADMGEKPSGMSIERRDNNSGYSPQNCYWSTPLQQANNRRSNRLITYEGKTQTIAMWNREKGFQPWTISDRLKAGWTIEEALTTPINSHIDILMALAKIQGICIRVVRQRIKQGWTQEEALRTPVRKYTKRERL